MTQPDKPNQRSNQLEALRELVQAAGSCEYHLGRAYHGDLEGAPEAGADLRAALARIDLEAWERLVAESGNATDALNDWSGGDGNTDEAKYADALSAALAPFQAPTPPTTRENGLEGPSGPQQGNSEADCGAEYEPHDGWTWQR